MSHHCRCESKHPERKERHQHDHKDHKCRKHDDEHKCRKHDDEHKCRKHDDHKHHDEHKCHKHDDHKCCKHDEKNKASKRKDHKCSKTPITPQAMESVSVLFTEAGIWPVPAGVTSATFTLHGGGGGSGGGGGGGGALSAIGNPMIPIGPGLFAGGGGQGGFGGLPGETRIFNVLNLVSGEAFDIIIGAGGLGGFGGAGGAPAIKEAIPMDGATGTPGFNGGDTIVVATGEPVYDATGGVGGSGGEGAGPGGGAAGGGIPGMSFGAGIPGANGNQGASTGLGGGIFPVRGGNGGTGSSAPLIPRRFLGGKGGISVIPPTTATPGENGSLGVKPPCGGPGSGGGGGAGGSASSLTNPTAGTKGGNGVQGHPGCVIITYPKPM